MRRGQSGVNCLFGIDKPGGPSSHDVVNRVRRALLERRVGHAGTLDPAASGVLVVGVGQATRLLGMLTLDEKTYEAKIAFGRETSTDDAQGETTCEAHVSAELLDATFATAALARLVGTFEQVPPAYSAVSVDGRRAYDRARSGERFELSARRVTVHEAHLLDVDASGAEPTWTVRLRVSKGTYVRSIARDLGRALGGAAHLAQLRRTSSGPVDLSFCTTLEQLERSGVQGASGLALDPVVALGLAFRSVSETELDDITSGRAVAAGMCVDATGAVREVMASERVSLVHGTSLVGVWQRDGNVLKSVATFPAGISGVRR